MSDVKFAELLKLESTANIEAIESYSYQNIVDIENITRTWFQLMVNLNESPKVRSFFASETYNKDTENWDIKATDYTRHFLTSGVIVYEAKEISSGKVSTIVITAESSQEDIVRIHELSMQSGFEVVALVRWAGCGMKIPSNATLELDPNIVWPILTFDTEVDGEIVAIEIANSSNQITWKETNQGAEEQGKMMVTDKNAQGQASGKFNVSGNVDPETIKLVLPYTCASFDILTEIHLGDDNSEIVIFTS